MERRSHCFGNDHDVGALLVAVVPVVLAAEHFDVEVGPLVQGFVGFPFELCRKGMAGRANADQRLAGFQKVANVGQLSLRQRPAADRHQEHVGPINGFNPGKVIRVLRVGVQQGAFDAEGFELALGKRGERFPGFVFILADQKGDLERGRLSGGLRLGGPR